MSDVIPLEDIEPTGIDEYPADHSVKLHGPPGTGKTTQSAGRVGMLLRDYGYSLSDVAWCTYRRSLAFDTLNRFVAWDLLDEAELAKPHEGQTRYISTIHAVANRTVGELPDPVQPGHKIDFCNRLDVQYMSQDPWDDTPGRTLFRVFEWLKNNCYDPAKQEDVQECPFVSDLRQQWNGSVPAVWNQWEDYKAQKDIIGFHEMLEAPIRENAVPTNKVLVIDEFHDATPLMARLCEFWIDAAEIVIVAGDPNQVVNAFDGAHPRFFEDLDLPKVLLDKTYRVPEEHWRAATTLLERAHDTPPVDRMSHGQITEYRSPQFGYADEGGWNTPAPNSEAGPAAIVDEYGPDTLFLTRMQMQADGVGHALEKAGIIYSSQADLNGWDTDDGEERLSLFNATQKISGFESGHFGGGGGLFGYEEPPRNPEAVVFTPDELVALLSYTNAKYLQENRSDVEAFCDQVKRNGDTATVSELAASHVTDEFWSNHNRPATAVRNFNKGGMSQRDRVALEQALKRYDEPVSLEDIETGVLTIHASKGQEAEDVVIYDGVSRRIRREMTASETLADNEWRTWYVAMTRAKKRLHIMRNAFQWTSSVIPTDIRSYAGGAAADD